MRTSYDAVKRCPDTNHAFFSKLLKTIILFSSCLSSSSRFSNVRPSSAQQHGWHILHSTRLPLRPRLPSTSTWSADYFFFELRFLDETSCPRKVFLERVRKLVVSNSIWRMLCRMSVIQPIPSRYVHSP